MAKRILSTRLAPELWAYVFIHLPLHDCLQVRLVSQQWKNGIDSLPMWVRKPSYNQSQKKRMKVEADTKSSFAVFLSSVLEIKCENLRQSAHKYAIERDQLRMELLQSQSTAQELAKREHKLEAERIMLKQQITELDRETDAACSGWMPSAVRESVSQQLGLRSFRQDCEEKLIAAMKEISTIRMKRKSFSDARNIYTEAMDRIATRIDIICEDIQKYKDHIQSLCNGKPQNQPKDGLEPASLKSKPNKQQEP